MSDTWPAALWLLGVVLCILVVWTRMTMVRTQDVIMMALKGTHETYMDALTILTADVDRLKRRVEELERNHGRTIAH